MFKNVSAFRLPSDYRWPDDATLTDALLSHEVRDPGPLELETCGFTALPSGHMVQRCDVATLLSVSHRSRLLPSSVLAAEVEKRTVAHEQETGRRPGKRVRSEIKEAALGELLPRAFIVEAKTSVLLDPSTGLILIDTTSSTRAEDIVSLLRQALGTLPARPLATEQSPRLCMANWLLYGAPDGFAIGADIKLEDTADTGSRISGANTDLSRAEIVELVREGMAVIELGLVAGHLSFALNAGCQIKRLAIGVEVAIGEDESAESWFAAELALMVGELRGLYRRLGDLLTFVE